MCVRYTLARAQRLELAHREIQMELHSRYNVAPTRIVPAVPLAPESAGPLWQSD